MLARLSLILVTVAFAQKTTRSCLFERMVAERKQATQSAYLAAFDPAKVDPTATQKIRSMRIVTDSEGRKYFVRFPSKFDPTDFEMFASEFLGKAPGVETPKLRRLSEAETKQLHEVLKRDVPDSAFPDGRATIAPFYEGMTSGLAYIRSRGIDSGEVTLENVKALPAELVTKLADLWALETILGIDDFHAENWMEHDGQVLGVDLANRSPTFVKGLVTIDISGAASPFGLGDLDYSTRRFLVRNLSPALKRYLRGVKEEQIEAMAVGAGYRLSQRELDGIVMRLTLMLED